MKALSRRVVLGLAGCFVLMLGSGSAAVAAGSIVPSSGSEASFWSGSLVIEGSPAEAEQRKSEEEGRLESPGAVAAREESETADENLGASEAEGLAGRLFPGLIDEADGGAPQLPEGERILGFPSDYAATVRLADGSRAVIESLTPIASGSGSGRSAIDLAPRQDGSGFQATSAAPGLDVRIGSQLREGTSLAGLGITMTPVSAGGMPLEAEGRLDGASIFYPDSEDAQAGVLDLDTVAKISSYGFREESILRSQRSPEALYFKISLPEGASLVQEGEGPVQVMDAGNSIATILAPAARDAEGTFVPVMAGIVGGDVIKIAVPHPAGRYRYPIVVDPSADDKQIVTENGHESNWTEWSSPTPPPSGPFHFREFNGYLEDRFEGHHGGEGWWGRTEYVTQGESHIGMFAAYVYGSVIPFQTESQYHSIMSIGSKSGASEAERSIPGYFNEERTTVCANPCKTIYEGSAGNHASYTQYFEHEGNDGFWTLVSRPEVVISQPYGPSASLDVSQSQTGLEPLSGRQVNLHNVGNGAWVNPERSGAAVEAEGADGGIGIYRVRLKSPQEGQTPYSNPYSSWIEPIAGCHGMQCPEHQLMEFSLLTKCGNSECSWLPEGDDTVTAELENAMGLWESKPATVTTTVKIDREPPHNIVLHGLPENGEVGAGSFQLSGEATDGHGTTPSSGIASLALYIDGKQVGSASGSCPEGPCTAKSGAWTIEPRNYAVGTHSVTIVATDNAGNVESSQVYPMIVRTAAPVSLGPGAVNPETGEFTLESSDVSMGGGLGVTRSYNSQHLQAGAAGPLGEQWSLSVGGEQSLAVQANGSVVVTGSSGRQTIFTAKAHEEGFTAPSGDSNLTMVYQPEGGQSHKPAYVLEDAATGSKTYFERPSSESQLWTPSVQKGLTATETVAYVYGAEKVGSRTLVEPKEALAPVPAGVECTLEITEEPAKQLKRGCRALTFNYAHATTATGEGEKEWGDYNGNLTRVYYTAWSGAAKEMKTVEVAHYLYDGKGRLRAEWDPRLKEELKTTYGYDGEGHVTAVAPPGEQGWALTYGTAVNGTSPGAILKVTRGLPQKGATQEQEEAQLKEQHEPLSNTQAPRISGSPIVGVRLAASAGKWSHTSMVYGYHWEDCSVNGGECTPIPGATNANYTATTRDLGYELVVRVGATDDAGTTIAVSEPTLPIASSLPNLRPSYTQGIDVNESLNSVSCIANTAECVVTDVNGNELYSTNVSVGGSASWTVWKGPSAKPGEAVDCPTTGLCLLAAGEHSGYGGSLYYATSIGGSWSEAYSPSYGVDAISCPSTSFCLDGQDGAGYYRYATSPASSSWTLLDQGNAAMKGVDCLSSSFCAIADNSGRVHVATSETQIKSTSWTETDVDGSTALNGIACTSTTSCVAVDAAGHVVNLVIGSNGAATASKQDIDGSTSINAITCTGNATCVAVDTSGSIFISANNGTSWEKDEVVSGDLTAVSCSTSVLCMTVNNDGYVTAFDPTVMQPIDVNESLNGVSCVPASSDCVVTDVNGNELYSTNVSVGGAASWTVWKGPSAKPGEAVDCPSSGLCLLAAGEDSGYGGNLYYATSIGGSWTQAYSPAYGVDAISCAPTSSGSFCLDGQDGDGYFRYATNPASTSWTLLDQGNAAMKGVDCLSSSFCAIADSNGRVHIATSTSQIESYSWTETDVDGSTALNGIACTSTTSCVAVDAAGNAIELSIGANGAATAVKHAIDGTHSLNAVACTTDTTCVAVDSEGRVFSSTNAGESWSQEYDFNADLTAISCSSAAMCSTTSQGGELAAINPAGPTIHEGEQRAPEAGMTVEYDVPRSGAEAPQQMGSEEVEAWDQKKDKPVEATAIFPTDEPQTWPATHYTKATVYYLDNEARTVNVATPGGGVATTEYNEQNDVIRSLSADNRSTALKEGSKSAEVAEHLSTQSEYNSEGTELQSTLGPEHLVKLENGKEVQARNHTVYSYDEKAPGEGGPYRLVTKTTQGVQITGEGEQNQRTTETSYSGQGNLGWTLRQPTSVTVDPKGLKLVSTTLYEAKTGEVTETHTPAAGEGGGNGGVHGTQTIYYTTAANSEHPQCGEHPEWATMPCLTQPAAQPETEGLPKLPVTEYTYNMYDEATTTKSTVEDNGKQSTRETDVTYDEAGRPTTTETKSTVGKAVPAVTDVYSKTTGALIEQKAPATGEAIKSAFNSLGQQTSYTDAAGATTSYEYEAEGDTRLKRLVEPHGSQTYTYNSTTGQTEKLEDSIGTFTATYDPEGNLLTQTYPNGMTATSTYNQTGEQTSIKYVKTTHCTENCTWFSDSVVPSAHGQWSAQNSSFADACYSYDAAGRLTQVQETVLGSNCTTPTPETPAGEGCTTRIYNFDNESNRLSLTTRQPNTEGHCTTEGGTVETHSYDAANRLTDTGITYEPFGEISKLPAADAGGLKLESSFYTNGHLAEQHQGEENIAYTLDPEGRVAKIVDSGTTNRTTINHYNGSGEPPSWSEEPTAGTWSRNIPGISGGLVAIQESSGTTELQIEDLQGNIVEKASLGETATKPSVLSLKFVRNMLRVC